MPFLWMFFISFFAYYNQKYEEFYADFKSTKTIGKQCMQKYLFADIFCKLVV